MPVSLVTLLISPSAGVFLDRNRFPGRSIVVAMLTLPLAFPGVVVEFMVIMLAGRQGVIGEISKLVAGRNLVFAYSIAGLFIGYVYFSIPRVILTVMASAEKLDRSIEEAARSLGASSWRVVIDVIIPGLMPAFVSAGGSARNVDGRVRYRLHARNRHQRLAYDNLHRVHAAGEHRYRGGAQRRTRRDHLDRARDCANGCGKHRRRGILRMRRNGPFVAQLLFTLLVCAFMFVPIVLSVMAGFTANYIRGISSGLTLAGSSRYGYCTRMRSHSRS